MAEVKAVPAKRIVRKRAGYRRVMVTLTEERAKVLDELAAADMRQGGATEILSVMVARNFDALVRATAPVQAQFTGFKQPIPKNPNVTLLSTIGSTDDKPYTINDTKE